MLYNVDWQRIIDDAITQSVLYIYMYVYIVDIHGKCYRRDGAIFSGHIARFI